MARYSLVVLLVVLPLVAWAQVEEEPVADGSAPAITSAEAAVNGVEIEYSPYVSTAFGFSLELPAGGRIIDPASEDWALEDEIAFEWHSGGDEPVSLISARVDRLSTDLDEASFDVFCNTLLEIWSDEGRYEVLTANRRIEIEDQSWNLIEIGDAGSGEDKMVYYSVFSMFAGENIYSISMYYLEPVTEEIQEFGIPIIYGFELTE